MIQPIIERIHKEKEVVEVVESKGPGHPDTLCDTLCNISSNALSKHYLKNFGEILHHNLDKGLLIAGKSEPKFGGGKILEPMKIIIAGRATAKVGKKAIPVNDIIIKTVTDYMKRFKHLTDFKVVPEVKEGASNLQEIFKKKVPVSNDTSMGVSHYPNSPTENMVLDIIRYLSSEEARKEFPAIGDDVKVMAIRTGTLVTFTVAVAFIDKFVKGIDDYKEIKHNLKIKLESLTGSKVNINTLDSYQNESTLYLTVSGLSAEMGDDGQVGRGNRYNGLITPNRPMGIEATAGKNVSHPGKLYQIMAHKLAKELVESGRLEDATVMLVTDIGKPIISPKLVSITTTGKYEEEEVKRIVAANFRNIKGIQQEIIND